MHCLAVNTVVYIRLYAVPKYKQNTSQFHIRMTIKSINKQLIHSFMIVNDKKEYVEYMHTITDSYSNHLTATRSEIS